MGTFGYRLFVIHLREGQKRRNIDFAYADDDHFINLLEADLSKGLNSIIKFEDAPKPGDDGTTTPETGTVFRLTEISRAGYDLRLEFDHGPYGEDGTLIDPDGVESDQEIDKYALGRPYRALIAFPPEGGAAILAVETHGRACPYRRVEAAFRRLYSTNLRLYLAAGVADRAAVAHFIRNGVVRELEVTRHETARDGEPLASQVRLSVKIPGASKLQESMREHALRWVNERWEKLTNRDARVELANDLARTATGVTIPLDFEDSLLRVDGPNDRKRSLKPSADIGEWIYDTGDYRYDNQKWYETVSESVRELYPTIAATEGVIPPD
ncbi:hypothetical protein ACTOB_002874 [Actinoplanes oblitus]|uniref:Uncharacterized protein n=1 Tax=Actinoplanes oblitus TaxID=3040509 RepID=A0ABY8WQ76_9ACTN|nr:hypothetical protein [Actinoplanes oblitus]WIM99228.1 hypothetical protein ACTOB_002874 [Actinoplanes oblitus]